MGDDHDHRGMERIAPLLGPDEGVEEDGDAVVDVCSRLAMRDSIKATWQAGGDAVCELMGFQGVLRDMQPNKGPYDCRSALMISICSKFWKLPQSCSLNRGSSLVS